MKKILFFAFIVLLTVSGCKKATYIKADKENIEVSRQGGVDSLTLSSDAGEFEIVSSPEWVKTELADSVLRMTITANPEATGRNGNVIIANGDVKLSVSVRQKAPATYLTIADKSITLGPKGEAATLKVETDGADVKIEGVEGLSSTYSNGVLTITGKGNQGATRKSKATITCDTITRQITVVESGAFCGKCSGKGRITCTICGGSGVDYCPYRPCDTCRGRKVISCPSCGGKGK